MYEWVSNLDSTETEVLGPLTLTFLKNSICVLQVPKDSRSVSFHQYPVAKMSKVVSQCRLTTADILSSYIFLMAAINGIPVLIYFSRNTPLQREQNDQLQVKVMSYALKSRNSVLLLQYNYFLHQNSAEKGMT